MGIESTPSQGQHNYTYQCRFETTHKPYLVTYINQTHVFECRVVSLDLRVELNKIMCYIVQPT